MVSCCSNATLHSSQIHTFNISASWNTALSKIERYNFSHPSISITILDGTNILDAGHNFRFHHCVHFRANVLKPTIFAFLETLVILAISDQHCKFRFRTNDFHLHFSFVNKNPRFRPAWRRLQKAWICVLIRYSVTADKTPPNTLPTQILYCIPSQKSRGN